MLHSAEHNDHMGKVRKLAKSAGYSTGGQNHSMKKIAKAVADKEVHKHEKSEHHGKITKLKEGGHADGKHPKMRLDKMARGGAKKGSKVAVNVIVPRGEKTPMPMPVPAAGVGGSPMGARPPMAPPAAPMAPGGPPPQGMMRPAGMKTGGKAAPHMDAGAGGGMGRLEKAANEKKMMKGKKGGGEC